MSAPAQLLTEPFLQLPTASSVRVVWFTEFAGRHHSVEYGANLNQSAVAQTTQLSRMREDEESTTSRTYTATTERLIWRHEAEVTGLIPGQRLPYRVTSIREDGASVSSEVFSLAATPIAGTAMKILLTSDHQLKPMVTANLQKVVETVESVDLVLFAGDLVNIPDRASEWFDDNRGVAFFPALQGRANYEFEKQGIKTCYRGGALIQSAPMYCAIGNHEIMGRFSDSTSLDDQFDDTVPVAAAAQLYEQKAAFLNPTNDPTIRDVWLQDHSFNATTYEEIFTLPESQSGGEQYYAVTFGDMRLVVLYITNMWRPYKLDADVKGRYQERKQDFDQPENWGQGQIVFGEIAKGTPQYDWLQQELSSPEFQQARYKVVMFHHPPHTLGGNIVPAYTDPVQVIDRHSDGSIKAIRYEYPQAADYIIRDVVPLLETAGVQLVFYGHSHLWNRFVSPSGMHFLETSNVGNSYGAHVGANAREVPTHYQENYVALGNPNGLEPVVPTIAPLIDETGQPQPYIASNDITVFSIFETGTGTVSSYYFDTRDPQSAVVKFDQFQLKE